MIETIPEGHWEEACRGFAERHRGWLMRLSITSTAALSAAPGDGANGTGSTTLAADLPLKDIMVEHPGGEAAIRILAGAGAERISHPVARARLLALERRPDGSEAGLRIDDAGGTTTLLRFRVSAAPETLDGLAPGEL